jgi:hypothetical protein
MSKVNYNQEKNQVEITDKWIQSPWTLYMLMILNIINSGLRLVPIPETGIGFIEMVWIFVGAASIVVLVLMIKNRSTQNTIPLEDIEDVSQKTTWGNSAYYFQLKNGKKRYLTDIKRFLELSDVADKIRGEAGLPFQQG